MLQPGSSTRSKELEPEAALDHLALHQLALEDECRRLHFLIAELLRTNQELRSQVARFESAHHFE
jgi:hypothetical protein